MESVAHTEAACGPTGGSLDPRAARQLEPDSAATGDRLPAEADPTFGRLKDLLVREAARLRQNVSGSMTVVVCVEDGPKLLVHFAQRDAEFDVNARCEPTDAPRLGAIWPRLQEALAARRIHLAPLRSRDAGRGSASPFAPPMLPPDGGLQRNGPPPVRPDWETWA